MRVVKITAGTPEDFFRRGKEIARRADVGEEIPAETVIAFENPEEILALITPARVEVFRAVKHHPQSIADIARRLHRDRSAVSRDVEILSRAGLVAVEERPFPGHGKKKEVKALAESFRLEALVV